MTGVPLRIELLGSPGLWRDERRLEIPGSRKTRALLGYLLLQKRPASRESLCELLWPTPDDPRAALRWSLSKLRPLVGADPIHWKVDRRTVAIQGFDACVDVCIVESIAAMPRAEVSTAKLERAAGLLGGELLEGHELSDCHRFYEWLMARRESLRRSHTDILEELVLRHRDRPERQLAFARSLVTLDPLQEAHHRRLVEILRGLGRMQEARAQIEHCRSLFEAELGIRPSFSVLAPSLRTAPEVMEGEALVADPQAVGLFGRAEECALIEEFLVSAREGVRTPVMLLEGEAGIGKTRLLEELSRRAASQPLRVLRARSWEAEMVRPLAAWADLLHDAVDSEEIDDGWRRDLGEILPGEEGSVATKVEESRLFLAVIGLLESMVPTRGALVLAFDDLQWMDASSSALLSYVVRRRSDRVSVVCTGRPDELADDTPARALLRDWSRSEMLHRVELAGLEVAAAAALARSISSRSCPEEIVERCGGNPFFLIAMARTRGDDLPEDVRQLLFDRLASLPPAARSIATWIAVLGREMPVAWLEDVAQGDPALLPDTLSALRCAGVLTLQEESCDFSHDLMRQAAYSRLSGAERRILHRQVARFLSGIAESDEGWCSDLAYHAARGGMPVTAAKAAVAAGERALRMTARDEARALAHRALNGLGNEDSTPLVLELRGALLRLMVHAGLGRRDVDYLHGHLRQLAQEAAAMGLGGVERTACYLLSILFEESGNFESAQDHSLRAERAGRGADDRTRLVAVANTARCLIQLEREPRRVAELLDEAEFLARELGESNLDIPWGRGLLSALEGDAAQAQRCLAAGVRSARTAENHWAEFECLAGLSKLDLETGNYPEVDERHRALLEVAGRLGEGSESAFARCLLSLARRGDGGAGEAALELALDDLRQADTKGRLAYCLNTAAEMDLRDGDLELATTRAAEALAAAEAVGRPVQMARAVALKGLVEVAARRLESAQAELIALDALVGSLGSHPTARSHWIRLQSAITAQGGSPPLSNPPVSPND